MKSYADCFGFTEDLLFWKEKVLIDYQNKMRDNVCKKYYIYWG